MRIDIDVPEGFDQITLDQWLKGRAVQEKGLSDFETSRQIVGIMCKLSQKQIESLTAGTVGQCALLLQWMQEEIDLTKAHDVVESFQLRGVEYGFIPDFNKLSTGEFIDLDNYASKGWYKHLPEVMSVLYRPITVRHLYTYDIESYAPSEHRASLMREAPMHAVLAAMVFFSRIGRRLASDSLRSLKVERNQHSGRSGGGTARSTTLRKRT